MGPGGTLPFQPTLILPEPCLGSSMSRPLVGSSPASQHDPGSASSCQIPPTLDLRSKTRYEIGRCTDLATSFRVFAITIPADPAPTMATRISPPASIASPSSLSSSSRRSSSGGLIWSRVDRMTKQLFPTFTPDHPSSNF